MYCPHCGGNVGANQRFCTSCGKQLPVQGAKSEEQEIKENKVYAVISYIGFLSLVSYFAAPKSPFVRFHAIQGVNLFIFEVIASVLGTFFVRLSLGVLGVLSSFLLTLGSLAFFAFSIIGIIWAFQGEEKELPFIGQIKLVRE